MDILNKNGQILLDYRTEFKRHYAESVDEALKNAVYLLYKENRINEKLFRMILDEDTDDLEIYTYLLTQKDFTKSPAELNYEYDKIRQKVNDYLISIGMVSNVSTKNDLNQNKIIILRQFDVSKEILLQYFGLTATEIIPLMKRRGFMDKFCVLRLNQIFKEIYSELRMPEHIDQGYSLVYYNKEVQGFSIDYKYAVNVNYLADETHLKEVLNKIRDLDRLCEKKFQNKMNFMYFASQGSPSKKKAPPELKFPEPSKTVSPVTPIPPPAKTTREDIRSPEIIVDNVIPTTKPPEAPKTPQKSPAVPSPNQQKQGVHSQQKPQGGQQKPKPPNQQKRDGFQTQPKPTPPPKAPTNPPKPEEKPQLKEKEDKPIMPTFIDVPTISVDEDDKDLL